jgi:hypothetical protein
MNVEKRHPSRLRTRLTAFIVTMMLLLADSAVVAACGSSTTSGSPPEAAASGIPSGSPAAYASPVTVREFRGMLPCVSTSSLVKERPYASTKTVGDVVQGRHAVWTFRRASSDPRLAGTEVVVINVDQRQSDMSATMWGTSRLRNAGGTWVKRWTGGIAAGGDVHHFYGTLKGTGGYAGLVAHVSAWVAESGEGFTADLRIVEAAWIETTDGSPVPPAPGPGTTPANWTPVVGIATTRKTAYEGPGPWVWDVEQSDPRVTGRLEGDIEGIAGTRPDGSLDYRVESTISNEDGGWNSPWSTDPMVRGPRPDYEHFQYWKSTGSGAYAGLTYHGFWYFPERKSLRPGDTFVWSGWIEEAK